MLPEQPRILITGGGSGIGRALAAAAAKDGARIAICGRRLEALAETGRLIASTEEPVLIPADLTQENDRQRVIETLSQSWGGLDVLINNAGLVEGGEHQSLDEAAVERMFAINVLAPMALTRALFPLLAANRSSRVVNVGSVFGDIAFPGFAAYSASKFALRGFSSALAREWKSYGIGVTYAAPRATRTGAAEAFSDLIAESGMALDAPEAIAARIWAAIRAGHRSVYPKGPERLFIALQQFFPSFIDRAVTPKGAVNAACPPHNS